MRNHSITQQSRDGLRRAQSSREYSRTILLSMAVLLLACGWAAAYSGGDGSPENPYQIATAEDMNQIGAKPDDWDAHFLLIDDINLADYTGTQFNIIGDANTNNPFNGVFDGNDHKVWNFTWISTGRNNIGLFGYVGIGGQIKNLGLENVNININAGDRSYVSGLVGKNYGGTITNCYSTGSVVGNATDLNFVGGLVGNNEAGTITNCYSTGSVIGTATDRNFVGGLVGGNGDTITHCYSTGSVVGNATDRNFVGGLVGNNGGPVTNCYSTGDVNGMGDYVGGLVGYNSDGVITNSYSSGSVSGGGPVGGLVGYNDGMIINCYSTGSVTGIWEVGGLVGENSGWNGSATFANITNCYSTGSVTGDWEVGGLVGHNGMSCTITKCYSTGSVSGQGIVGGLVGKNSDSGGSTFAAHITNCYSTGSVSGIGWAVGGLVGYNGEIFCWEGEEYPYPGYIYNCYSTGEVTSSDAVGGLVGYNEASTIADCYSTGSVSGQGSVGGLVGHDYHGTITASFWDTETSDCNTSAIGTPKTTAEMKTKSTFTGDGWDFIEIWDIGENQTYPFLRIYYAGDINHDDIVNFYDFVMLADHWLEGAQ